MKVLLVIDDEVDILETLALVLRMEGYSVLMASNGKMGLERIKEKTPDLVISDVMMPVMTGLEMLRSVRSNPATKQIPVLLMSAGQPPAENANYQWTEFMGKPLSLDHFLKVVAEILTNQSHQEGRYFHQQ